LGGGMYVHAYIFWNILSFNVVIHSEAPFH